VIAGLRVLLERLTAFVAVLLGTAMLVEGLLILAPGDAIDLLPDSGPVRAFIEQQWGMDLPFHLRLWLRLSQLLHGDLGYSLTYRPGADVKSLVWAAGSQSLGLLLPAMGITMALGLGLALLPLRGRLVRLLSVVPTFMASFLLINGVNAGVWLLVERGTIPRPTWFALPAERGPVPWALAVAVLAVASGTLGEVHSACSLGIAQLREAPFVLASRARGDASLRVLARNLLPQLAAVLSSRSATLVGGVVVVEKLFLLNGAGATFWNACLYRDYPLVVGLSLAAAATVATLRLLTDLLRITLDPRLRTGSGG